MVFLLVNRVEAYIRWRLSGRWNLGLCNLGWDYLVVIEYSTVCYIVSL